VGGFATNAISAPQWRFRAHGSTYGRAEAARSCRLSIRWSRSIDTTRAGTTS
jgi:hypothetical protein